MLVPKGDRDRRDLSSFPPVTVGNVDRKLVAALFVSRLRELLSRLANPQQCSSVPGHSIFPHSRPPRDLFAYDVHTRFRRLFISCDQSLAFYRLEHAYMRHCAVYTRLP